MVAEFEDDGISGAEFERRPGFQAMLTAARRGDFHYLIVSEQKSLGSESYETQHTIKRLAQAGEDVWLYMDARSLTTRNAMDKAMSSLRVFGDEAHREDTARRTPTKPTGRKFSVGLWSGIGYLGTGTSTSTADPTRMVILCVRAPVAWSTRRKPPWCDKSSSATPMVRA